MQACMHVYVCLCLRACVHGCLFICMVVFRLGLSACIYVWLSGCLSVCHNYGQLQPQKFCPTRSIVLALAIRLTKAEPTRKRKMA